MYGKIYGPLWTYINDDSKTATVEMTYFLNPDGTNNVEFDLAQNLLKKFSVGEYPPQVP